ncbi:uncharacterized protein TNCV_188441 [Trichonephila clavipes]|nr:uncharacterized protein TNCV_188441 [Trichonephila clavipes]
MRKREREFNPAFPSGEVSEKDSNAVFAINQKKGTTSVFLSSVKCFVKDSYDEKWKIRGLLDVGSMTNLITKKFVEKLGLRKEKVNLMVTCLNDSSVCVKNCVTTEIPNSDGSYKKRIKMLVVDKITDLIPVKNLNVKGLIPENINLADDSFYVPGPIDCLLGAEIFYELLRSGQIRSENSNLIFQNTVFGFVASGSNSFADIEARVHCGLIKGDLNQTLKMFWELENVEVEKTKNEEAIFCEDHLLKTHSRDEEGRYVVKMPLKNEPNCLGESRGMALKRLNALWTRLIRDPQYLKLYRDFIHEYDQLCHMKEVVAEHDNSEVAYYMPHHGVLRPEKSTTKLRVVFNATNPTSNGLSLNSIQYNGGLAQNDLFTIMIKFREHPYAFTADVKMMYRMILIHESQQPLLRILWKESPEDPVKTFEMKTVTYGTVSAPFLATRTLLQLSRDEEKNFPLAAPVLRENFYMDDVLCGAASLMEAKALKNQLSGILKKGGMELHKWGSSHPELASNILGDYEFENPIETKTLGVSWKSQEDCFIFKIAVELKDSYTKRYVLSTIARLFDPLGLLGPVVARAKIFMQSLWSLKIDWINELPSERAKEWHRFLEDFNSVRSICIGGCIMHPQATRVELHDFADASEKCFEAVIYCRSQSPDGATTVKLVTSKSRVAPVKSVTMPRLELCAAVLLAKLMKRVETALQMKTPPVYLRSDSTIVLAWIQKEPITCLKPSWQIELPQSNT